MVPPCAEVASLRCKEAQTRIYLHIEKKRVNYSTQREVAFIFFLDKEKMPVSENEEAVASRRLPFFLSLMPVGKSLPLRIGEIRYSFSSQNWPCGKVNIAYTAYYHPKTEYCTKFPDDAWKAKGFGYYGEYITSMNVMETAGVTHFCPGRLCEPPRKIQLLNAKISPFVITPAKIWIYNIEAFGVNTSHRKFVDRHLRNELTQE